MDLKTQIKIIKIVNIVLVVAVVVAAYFVFVKWQSLGKHEIITGKLIYLKEISDPENPEVGVYLRLHLEYPEHVKFGDGGYCGVLRIYNKTNAVGIPLENTTGNEREGFVVDVEDKNGNGFIDTGDEFHIYGRKLGGYEVSFTITGVSGNIHIKIW